MPVSLPFSAASPSRHRFRYLLDEPGVQSRDTAPLTLPLGGRLLDHTREPRGGNSIPGERFDSYLELLSAADRPIAIGQKP